MDVKDIGPIVRYHRKRAGLTLKRCADLAGIGKTSLFDIENGKETVRVATLVAVLDSLNISLSLVSPLMEEYRAKRDRQIPR